MMEDFIVFLIYYSNFLPHSGQYLGKSSLVEN